MKINCLVLSASLLLLAGCGNTNLTSKTTTSTPSSPASTTSMTVNSPTAGAAVSSPFQVSATATSCQSQAVNSIGYSLDQGKADQVTGTALQAQVTAGAGAHTVHVVAWGADGASCNADVAVTVSAATPPSTGTASGPSIPESAVTVSEIQQLPVWKSEFDAGTGSGSSNGVMTLVSSPSLSGSALQFQTSFTNNGGERYHATFDSDPIASNFVYDAWVYLASPADSVANIEMDMNQVVANGQTVIYGFQCDGYSSTWDIAENAGTPEAPSAHWVHTGSACNPQNWSTDAWHHVQAAFSRDDAGNVTYQAIWFDGVALEINQTVPSSFALGWAPALLTNFQVDGRGASGANTIYLDNLTVSRW